MSQVSVSPPKSVAIAYLLWFFLGGFGIHRFYLRKPQTAVIMLILTVAGYILTFVVVGFLLLWAVGIWWIVDAFLIPGMIREANGMNY